VITDLPDTDTAKVNSALIELRKSFGSLALSRVLTLVVAVDELHAEPAIAAASDASREHPCRILVLALGNRRSGARLDAQVRVGGDAGAGEVVVLRLHGRLAEHGESVVLPLLLPDAPVVAWWPSTAPANPSTHPIGRLAHRRITDVGETKRPSKALEDRRADYRPGDTDMAWTRITTWRAMLAAALDQPPYERVQSASVTATGTSASGELLAGWLAMMLDCPVTRYRGGEAGISEVVLERSSGPIVLRRPDGVHAVLAQPGQPERNIVLPRRTLAECLAEELRRLDPDDVYAEALTEGTVRISQGGPRRVPSGSAGHRRSARRSPGVVSVAGADGSSTATDTTRATPTTTGGSRSGAAGPKATRGTSATAVAAPVKPAKTGRRRSPA
jgi:glucose-6-phosphate dehydrogenase assembly protein OpcA